MELIVISKSKLKIMLTPPDMQRYELCDGQMDCADEQTRRAFRHIFDDARDQIGFDTEGERLFVQLYTSRGGGCEIFVTKLGTRSGTCTYDTVTPSEAALLRRVMEHNTDEIEDIEMNADRNTSDTPLLPVRVTPSTPVALVFSSISILSSACRRLLTLGDHRDSQAYILSASSADQTPCCLVLSVPRTSLYRLPDAYAFLLEYGCLTDVEPLFLYLREHGRVLCDEDAVSVLGKL
jgi:negative regulator of genetic competence, sporulation and motility